MSIIIIIYEYIIWKHVLSLYVRKWVVWVVFLVKHFETRTNGGVRRVITRYHNNHSTAVVDLSRDERVHVCKNIVDWKNWNLRIRCIWAWIKIGKLYTHLRSRPEILQEQECLHKGRDIFWNLIQKDSRFFLHYDEKLQVWVLLFNKALTTREKYG